MPLACDELLYRQCHEDSHSCVRDEISLQVSGHQYNGEFCMYLPCKHKKKFGGLFSAYLAEDGSIAQHLAQSSQCWWKTAMQQHAMFYVHRTDRMFIFFPSLLEGMKPRAYSWLEMLVFRLLAGGRQLIMSQQSLFKLGLFFLRWKYAMHVCCYILRKWKCKSQQLIF